MYLRRTDPLPSLHKLALTRVEIDSVAAQPPPRRPGCCVLVGLVESTAARCPRLTLVCSNIRFSLRVWFATTLDAGTSPARRRLIFVYAPFRSAMRWNRPPQPRVSGGIRGLSRHVIVSLISRAQKFAAAGDHPGDRSSTALGHHLVLPIERATERVDVLKCPAAEKSSYPDRSCAAWKHTSLAYGLEEPSTFFDHSEAFRCCRGSPKV